MANPNSRADPVTGQFKIVTFNELCCLVRKVYLGKEKDMYYVSHTGKYKHKRFGEFMSGFVAELSAKI